MKRLILIMAFILAMCIPVHALTYDAESSTTFNNGYQWGGHPQKDRAWIWAKEMQGASELSGQLGTGKIWYVDSGRGVSGDGKSWSRAVITLEEANVLSLADGGANRGDVILIAQGHAENFSIANAADLDTAGITVIGIGNGANAPTFSYTTPAGELVFGAASVTIYNLRFFPASDDVLMAISVEAAGDNATIIGCEWVMPTTATNCFLDGIDLAGTAHDFRVYNSIYRNTSVTGPDHWIEAGNGFNHRMRIVGNDIMGDFDVSAIWSNDVDEDAYIAYNTIRNKDSSEHAIEFTAAATGMICYNAIYTDASPTSIDPGEMMLVENYVANETDRSAELYPSDQ
jgi:hypothetical protein